MKIIRSQDKLQAVNAEQIRFIDIIEHVDDDGEETGEMDIDIYLNVGRNKDSYFETLATYNTEAECVFHLNKLVDFLGSSATYGVYDMPKF